MSRSDQFRPSNRVETVQIHQEFVNIPVRRYVNDEQAAKREKALHRTLHNRNIAEQDMREQVRDALYTPAYTGPVGTHRKGEDTMPSREEVYGSATEPDLQHIERVHIEHVLYNKRPVAQIEKDAIRLLARQRYASRLRAEELAERSARELGFGGREGVYV